MSAPGRGEPVEETGQECGYMVGGGCGGSCLKAVKEHMTQALLT